MHILKKTLINGGIYYFPPFTNIYILQLKTASGKTILAALDVRNFNPGRMLFVVHREQILIKTMEPFKHIFGTKYSYGLYTGNEKSIDSDMIFATNITLSKNIDIFDSKDFDYIILDECHGI